MLSCTRTKRSSRGSSHSAPTARVKAASFSSSHSASLLGPLSAGPCSLLCLLACVHRGGENKGIMACTPMGAAPRRSCSACTNTSAQYNEARAWQWPAIARPTPPAPAPPTHRPPQLLQQAVHISRAVERGRQRGQQRGRGCVVGDVLDAVKVVLQVRLRILQEWPGGSVEAAWVRAGRQGPLGRLPAAGASVCSTRTSRQDGHCAHWPAPCARWRPCPAAPPAAPPPRRLVPLHHRRHPAPSAGRHSTLQLRLRRRQLPPRGCAVCACARCRRGRRAGVSTARPRRRA